MTKRLRDLIAEVRAAKGIQDERKVITTEAALIRTPSSISLTKPGIAFLSSLLPLLGRFFALHSLI